MCGSTWAFEIPTGNSDVVIHWDNTLKYNLGVRVQHQEGEILRSVNYDDGDRNFHRGGIVTSRMDVLSEFDLRYRQVWGFRVSGAFWYDPAYEHLDNHSLLTSNSINHGKESLSLSTVSDRLLKGPYGELLDAFVFGKIDAGPFPINIKLGRHTIYWGESVMANESIAYSQAPLDLVKGTAVPSSELKEIFRPLTQVSAVAQLTPSLSLAGQQYFEWQQYRYSPDGGYLSTADIFGRSATSLLLAPGVFLKHVRDREPDPTKDFGVALRWSPPWLSGTLGVYYRRFSDMNPSQAVLDPARKQYFLTFGSDIDLYGVSLTQQILGFGVGGELSFRHNMTLASDIAVIKPKQPYPEHGDILGARGDTYHFVLNVSRQLERSPLYDTASALVELSGSGYTSVNHDVNHLFKGRSVRYGVDDTGKIALGLAVTITPQWLEVFPGMNLSVPLTWNGGIYGEPCVTTAASHGAGSYSIGLAMDVFRRYTFTLAYIGYYGNLWQNPLTRAVSQAANLGSYLDDRGWISFTFKTNF
jgi:hypothetical protein